MEKKIKYDIESFDSMYITCDLWGTLLLDEQSEQMLDKLRAIILCELFSEIGQCSSNDIWMEKIQTEREAFKEAEMKGIVLSSEERLHRITMGQLDKDYEFRLKNQFSEAVYSALPRINTKLLNSLIKIRGKNHCLAIISNTGLIDSETTYTLLEKTGVGQHFDYIFLSEEIGLCKPDPCFFETAAKKMETETKKMLHIGDSYEKDYLPAIKAGCKAFLYNGKNKI